MSEPSVQFPGVYGHLSVQSRLRRAIERDKLHHGLILMGPRGIGKATLARGLACALHCPVQPALGCGTCSTCQRIRSDLHAGVEWIRPEVEGRTIKVEVARELSHRLPHAPFEGRRHLVIFDPADALSEPAYNALLKSIEEPIAGVHFMMITTRPDGLLPTILSRCLPIRLGPLPTELVAQLVDRQLAQQYADPDPDDPDAADHDRPPLPDAQQRQLAVRLCAGSVGRAMELLVDTSLPQSLAFVREAINATARGPRGIFGGDQGPLWTAWQSATGGPGAGRPARERAACARAIDLWLVHLREHLRHGDGLPGLAPPHGPIDTIVRQLDRLAALSERLDRNPNVRVSIEQTLLELSESPKVDHAAPRPHP